MTAVGGDSGLRVEQRDAGAGDHPAVLVANGAEHAAAFKLREEGREQGKNRPRHEESRFHTQTPWVQRITPVARWRCALAQSVHNIGFRMENGGIMMNHLRAICVLAACAFTVPAQEMPKDYQDVLSKLGKKGDYKENVLKINIPRSDLAVSVDGVATPTAFGFGGWLAMTKGSGGHDVMMGDLVLLQEEVNPVMTAMLDSGLEVTALHNHFFYDEPRMFYMHVMGHGTPQELAQRAKPGLDLIGTIARHPARSMASRAARRSAPAAPRLDTAKIAKIVGRGRAGRTVGLQNHRRARRFEDRRDGRPHQQPHGSEYMGRLTGSDSDAAIAGDVASSK